MDGVAPDDPLARLARIVQDFAPERDAITIGGRVTGIGGGHYNVVGLGRHVEMRDVLQAGGCAPVPVGEVAATSEHGVVVFPFDQDFRLKLGDTVFRRGPLSVAPTEAWLGRTVDALGEPVDGLGRLPRGANARRIYSSPPPAMRRRLIEKGIRTGVKAIDVFVPLCEGQRLGIFAGSGVGKSSLLGMLTASDGFDVAIVGLIGERGREVGEFVRRLAPARGKTVVVAATGDESALLRRTAALTTMAIAEHFRDEGRSVLLVIDSITRFALACREIAIATGEPPVSRGFPPSVFTELPRLLERAGPGAQGAGSITALFAVLVDGDDHNDPIADAVRGIVDGHIVLQRSIAIQGRYPAIDIPASLSRLADIALPPERQSVSAKLRALVSRYEDSRDLRGLGGYQPGSDPDLDAALAVVPRIYAAIAQSTVEPGGEDAFKEIAEALRPLSTAPGIAA